MVIWPLLLGMLLKGVGFFSVFFFFFCLFLVLFFFLNGGRRFIWSMRECGGNGCCLLQSSSGIYSQLCRRRVSSSKDWGAHCFGASPSQQPSPVSLLCASGLSCYTQQKGVRPTKRAPDHPSGLWFQEWAARVSPRPQSVAPGVACV